MPYMLRGFVCACVSCFIAVSVRAEEFRAAWVASVYNINFPSRSGLSAEAQKEQIREIVSLARRVGLNALMVQVRPESDALYDSHLEPWSRFLTGKQGMAPGYDPLQYFIQEGYQNGIGIHAWINPYRAAVNAAASRAPNNITQMLPSATRRISSSLWLDPGDPEVQSHIVEVVRDIVRHYPVSGIILDDYFYPYPSDGHPRGTFPDRLTYVRYGRGMNLPEWRRQNVNKLISQLHDVI
ncbi:MAG: family 10 glycosylhydrolase, partial [Verrucomicrobia bacterium]|nr:family 10 glycosylhydrolase [Verrucomicrobiota bacterium]